MLGRAEVPHACAAATGSRRHLLNCQFAAWYETFVGCTPRSIVIPLSEEVAKYLRDDSEGIVLPRGFELSGGGGDWSDSDEWASDDGGGASHTDEEGSEQAVPEFPDLLQSLYDGIEQLGGAVFPKLNWSAPLDAAWVNGGSLKCVTPGNVVTLLKSSLFASHDLAHAAGAVATNAPSEGAVAAADGRALADGSDGVAQCNSCAAAEATAIDAQEVDAPEQLQDPVQLTLVLRKWCNLLPAMVFRCFVAHGRILGVSQRDCTCHYAFLQERAEEIGALLSRFYSSRVHGKFPDPCFVLDAYVDRGNRVWLLDINVFAAATDSLLFSWDELHDMALALETDPASAAAEHATAHPRQGATCIDTEASDANGVSYTFQVRLTSDDASKLVSDPMGQYRGPSDVELLATGGSSVDIDALRELMRRQE